MLERLLAFGGFRDGADWRDHPESSGVVSLGESSGGGRNRALRSWRSAEEAAANEINLAADNSTSTITSSNAAIEDDDYVENGYGDGTGDAENTNSGGGGGVGESFAEHNA